MIRPHSEFAFRKLILSEHLQFPIPSIPNAARIDIINFDNIDRPVASAANKTVGIFDKAKGCDFTTRTMLMRLSGSMSNVPFKSGSVPDFDGAVVSARNEEDMIRSN